MSTDWASRWLDLIESAPVYDEAALRRGADYVAYDWQLDLEIEAGRAATTATSGPRMQYEATIEIPVLTAEQTEDIVASIASSTERVAAVLDGELPLELDHVLDVDPTSIRGSCSCRSIDRPCKHEAAVAHLVADAIADDPFDLLHLRGLPRAELVAALARSRRAAEGEPEGEGLPDASPERASSEPTLQFVPATGAVPDDLPTPDTAGRLAPFPTPPPAGASFTEEGLRILADDGARRALDLLRDGRHEWTELDATTDLARRAAELEGGSDWKSLVERTQVTSQELRARAVAWRVGGPAAVSAQVAPVDVEPDPEDRSAQWRRTADGTWVRFHKVKGRWLAERVGAPGTDRTGEAGNSVDRPRAERQ